MTDQTSYPCENCKTMLKIGDKMPSFEVKDQDGNAAAQIL